MPNFERLQPEENTKELDQEIIEERKIKLELMNSAANDWRDKLSYVGDGTVGEIIPAELKEKVKQYDEKIGREGLSRETLDDEEWKDYVESLARLNDFWESAVQNRAEEEGVVWIGNWREGDRPEGYQRLTEKYKKLEEAGGKTGHSLKIFFQRKLGERWKISHNALMEKARHGMFTQDEFDALLADNQSYAEALDEFEKQIAES